MSKIVDALVKIKLIKSTQNYDSNLVLNIGVSEIDLLEEALKESLDYEVKVKYQESNYPILANQVNEYSKLLGESTLFREYQKLKYQHERLKTTYQSLLQKTLDESSMFSNMISYDLHQKHEVMRRESNFLNSKKDLQSFNFYLCIQDYINHSEFYEKGFEKTAINYDRLIKDIKKYFDNLAVIDDFKLKHPDITDEEMKKILIDEVRIYRELYKILSKVGR